MSALKVPAATSNGVGGPRLGVAMLLVLGALLLLLGGVFLPGTVLFSNDGPLGRLVAQCHHLPQRFFGCWVDLNAVGYSEGAAPPSISYGLQWLLGPVWLSKLYALLALLTLGLSVWTFCRQSGLVPVAGLLAALAAVLNSDFFCTACWGVGSHTLAAAMAFLAMAALANLSSRWRWWRVLLAGFAVGMCVTEGADLGAIFSVYVALYAAYQAFVAEGPRLKNLALGASRLLLIVTAAALLAAQAIFQLVGTDIKGVAGTEQDAQTRAMRWNWATQWSLPKRETLSLVVPGVFGYRMNMPDGSRYWGAIGRDGAWDGYLAGDRQGPAPRGLIRYVGGSIYAGVPVVLIAVWAAVQSFRRKEPLFSLGQRKWIWFWIVIGLGSLLLGFGRFAPFYHWFYSLPYLSTIRNPVKFVDLLTFGLVILFGYGVDALWRKYLRGPAPNQAARWAGLGSWWRKAAAHERWWLAGCVGVLGAGVLGWMYYGSCRDELVQYLQTVQFTIPVSQAIADFSTQQPLWFVLSFCLGAGLMMLMFSGAFAGRRARWGAIWLGLLVVADLARADRPWVVTWNYPDKYASNAILDVLRDRPYEHRVTSLPFRPGPELLVPEQLFRNEWLKHLFPYYNIQSVEVPQLPRVPEDLAAYDTTLTPHRDADVGPILFRRWQLTNTRYVLGTSAVFELVKRRMDPSGQAFRMVQRFDAVTRPTVARPVDAADLMAVPSDTGRFELAEFLPALPRARLYNNWQVVTNDYTALTSLTNRTFEPRQSVLVSSAIPPPPADGVGAQPGTVAFESYSPRDVVLKAETKTPAVLLFNDRYEPSWRVTVDGKPDKLLRCNYLMRGVYLTPGQHRLEFSFHPVLGPLPVSLAAIVAAVLVLGFVLVMEQRAGAPTPQPEPAQRPEPPASVPAPAQARTRKSERSTAKSTQSA